MDRMSQKKAAWELKRLILQFTASLLLCSLVFIGRGTSCRSAETILNRVFQVLSEDVTWMPALYKIKDVIPRRYAAPAQTSEGSEPIPTSQPIEAALPAELLEVCSREELRKHYYPYTNEPVKEKQEDASPVAGTVLLKYEGGEVLPEHYTRDHISFGALETMAPVMGHITSEFGYRTHPITGEYLFHGGTDIAGNRGDPIHAFADGTVDYIGRDDSYGLYMQLDHGNGIKSFYAHCSKLCMNKGDVVKRGDTIAEIGSTGVSTGPHLHFELKYGPLRLDPAYYLN